MHFLRAVPAFLTVILISLSGCGAPSGGVEADAVEPASVEEAALGAEQAADAAVGRTSSDGTLVLDGVEYGFYVRACDFEGESDDIYQTLSARGTTPDGAQFDLFVSRNDVGGMLSHTVSFQKGDIMRGEGMVLEAQRMRIGGTWSSVYDGPARPLVQIEGDRLEVIGRFGSPDGDGPIVDGRLVARCD